MDVHTLDATLRQRVGDLLGTDFTVVPVQGGYTQAARFVARCTDGRSVFVKAATTDETAAWLRSEHAVIDAVEGDFLPRIVAWDPDPYPILVLEDLSACRWPPPWPADGIERVLQTLEDVHATQPPHHLGLSSLEDDRAQLNGWTAVAANPRTFLSLGWCDEDWLDACLDPLLHAAQRAPLDGEALLHCDVRSDNLCICRDRVVLVDWNMAQVGNPDFDIAAWLPSLTLEGGPKPSETMPDSGGLSALIAGYFASRAGLPPPWPGSTVRDYQRQQLRIALPWACEELGLRPPP